MLQSAESVAVQVGAYRLADPPPEVSPDAIDELWSEYEPLLPRAIANLENGAWGEKEWAAVRAHITALAVRHPDFVRQAASFRERRGDPITHPDEIQAERIHTLRNTPALLARSRCAR